MNDLQPYFVLLCISLLMMFVQLLAKQKTLSHILFAMFCGSMAMMAAQKLTQTELGAYYYLVGMGACFTCNGYWLLARTLFRNDNAIALRHILLAASVAITLCVDLGLKTLVELSVLHSQSIAPVRVLLGEILVLLSSCMMLLTFREAYRGYGALEPSQKRIRLVFMGLYCLAAVMGSMMPSVFPEFGADGRFVTLAVVIVLIATQYLIVQKSKMQKLHNNGDKTHNATTHSARKSTAFTEQDKILVKNLDTLIEEQKIYLTSNLKVIDIAAALNVSEYRISQILRAYYAADNFNQFINRRRIEHAKSLLKAKEHSHWPVLVVGMESGFASVGPFNRAFKAETGETPNQYRRQALNKA